MIIKKYLTQQDDHLDKFWRVEIDGSSCTITSGRTGTFGKSSVSSFQSRRECLREVDKLLGMRLRRGYAESDEGIISCHALPPELRSALTKKRTFHTGRGRFSLVPSHDVALICVVLDPVAGQGWGDRQEGNPYKDTPGAFCTVGYALTAHTGGGDPQAVLVWLPDISLYGAWYPGDCRAIVFPGVTWQDITKDPAGYLWVSETGSFPDIRRYLRLWEHFDFIPANFSVRVGNILALGEGIRQKRVEEFLCRYEPILRKLPYCRALADTFESLVTLYYRMGLWCESSMAYKEAIPWFKRSLPFISQSYHLRARLFYDIYLQLGFCCLEASKFDAAIRYINIYQRYDASSWEACDQIKASIRRSQQLYKETMNSYLREMERESANGPEEVNGFIQQKVRTFPNDPILHFNLACFFAVSERINDALYHFEEALKKGFSNREKILTERDLRNVKHTRAFEDIRFKYLHKQPL